MKSFIKDPHYYLLQIYWIDELSNIAFKVTAKILTIQKWDNFDNKIDSFQHKKISTQLLIVFKF